MSLIFDGNGYVDLAGSWEPTDASNFEVEMTITPVSADSQAFWTGPSDRSILRYLSGNLYFAYRIGSTSGNWFYASAANPTVGEESTVRAKVVDSATIEFYLNGSLVLTKDITGDEITNYTIDRIGASDSGSLVLPIGTELHSIKFTDLADGNNSSVYDFDASSGTTLVDSGPRANNGTLVNFADPNSAWVSGAPAIRKSSTFDIETTLTGSLTGVGASATLNGNAITVNGHTGTTVNLTDDNSGITTSGEYSLVLTDDTAATETITVQVNVVGVAPSNNPLQKDGAALASLANVQVRIANGSNLNGVQRYYTATGTTDASGNLGNIDLSDTVAAVDDPVLLQILTAAGDSITATETVGLI